MSQINDVASVEDEKGLSPIDEKKANTGIDVESADDLDSEVHVLENERDIATTIVTTHDDPSLNPWTLRAFIIGIGLSAFGGVLGLYHFTLRNSFIC